MFCSKNTMLGTSKSIWGFDPRSISGCGLWLDGADSDAMVFSSGSNLSQWKDKSGNGLNTIALAGTGSPVYVPGSGVQFASNIFQLPNGSITVGSNNFSIFSVFRPTDLTNYPNVYYAGVGGTNPDTAHGLIIYPNGNVENGFTTDFMGQPGAGTIVASNTYMTSSVYDGKRTLWLDGTVIVPATAPTYVKNTTNSSNYVGGATPVSTSWFIGTIAELIVYPRAVTTTERQTIEGYLANKWGLVVQPISSPTSISGLALWLDGADRSTTSMTLSNLSVTTWKDKSGNGRNMTSAANYPLITSNGVQFNGTTQAPLSNAAGFSATTGVSAYVVFNPTTAATRMRMFFYMYTGIYPECSMDTTFISISNAVSTNYVGPLTYGTGSNILYSATTYSGPTLVYGINGVESSTWTSVGAPGAASAIKFSVGGETGVLFAGTIQEVLLYDAFLTTAQRKSIEKYLTNKWSASNLTSLATANPYSTLRPFNRAFTPLDIPACSVWLDAADGSTMNSTTTVTQWNDKSGAGNNVIGTATLSGSNMTFNGSTQAFSNTGYVFPASNYSMFAVYSNTTAPAATAYMNVVYGSNGYPMLGVYDVNKYVSARSVVANTGALVANVAASSNVLISATYTPSTFSPFINGSTATTLAGTTLATTGLYVGGPSNYFNGSLSELLIYASTLTSGQQQQLEGYLSRKWGLGSQLVSTQPYKYIPPITPTPIVATSVGVVTLSALTATGGTISWGVNSTLLEGYMWYVGTGQGTGGFVSGYVASGTNTVNFTATLTMGSTYYAWVTPYNVGGPGTVSYSTAASVPVTLPLATTQDGFLTAYTTAGVPRWGAQITSTGTSDQTSGIATDSSGNVFISGYMTAAPTLYGVGNATSVTLPFKGGAADTFLAKYTSNGAIAWAALIASAGQDGSFAVCTDSLGFVNVAGFYVTTGSLYNAGNTTTAAATLTYAGGTGGDFFLARYSNATGQLVWATRMSSVSLDANYGITTDSAGNILVTGYFNSNTVLYDQPGTTASWNLAFNSTSGYNVYIAKYTSAGTVVWATQMSTLSTSPVDVGYGIATDSACNVFVGGYFTTTSAMTMYNKGVSGTNGTVGGTLSGSTAGSYCCFLAKYDTNGIWQWAARMVSSNNNNIYSVATDPSGNVFAAGAFSPSFVLYSQSGANGTTPTITLPYSGAVGAAFVCAYTTAGVLTWAAQIDGPAATGYAECRGITTDSSGNVYVTGYYRSTTTITLSNALIASPASGGAASSYTLPISSAYGLSNIQFIVKYSPTGTVLNAVALRGENPTDLSYGYGLTINGTNLYTTGYYNARGAITLQPSGYAYPDVTVGGALARTFTAGGTNDTVICKYGSGGNTVWAARIFGAGNDYGQYLRTDPAGNSYAVGVYGIGAVTFTDGTGVSNANAKTLTSTTVDAYVAKYDTTGVPTWVARITSTASNDSANGVAVDTSGNVFVSGSYGADVTFSNANGSAGNTLTWTSTGVATTTDAFITKYDSNGSNLWAAKISSTSNDSGAAVATDTSGNVFVAGTYTAVVSFYNAGGAFANVLTYAGTVNNIFIAKYTTDGIVSWVAQLTGSGSFNQGYGIATDPFGNVFVGGSFNSSPLTIYNSSGVSNSSLTPVGGIDGFIVKYTPSGGVAWTARIGSTGTDQVFSIATDAAGNVYLSGGFNAALTFYNASGVSNASLAFLAGQDNFLVKYSPTGSVLWATRMAGPNSDYDQTLMTDQYGNVIVGGAFASNIVLYNADTTAGPTLPNTSTIIYGFIAKYTSAGNVLWGAVQSAAGTTSVIGGGTDSNGSIYGSIQYAGDVTLSNAITY